MAVGVVATVSGRDVAGAGRVDGVAPAGGHDATADDGARCRACGACCAAFRVSFHWLEGRALGLGDALVEPVTPHRVAMRGTHAKAPRCIALAGEVGVAVGCTTYASRPSPCREVRPGDERCTTARARHGLPALEDATPVS